MTSRQKIVAFLWYHKEAEEAAAFYASVFPDSRVDRVTALQTETPGDSPGSVKVVEFTLCGQPFIAMTAERPDAFNHAVSFAVNCDTQDEIDHYWNALLDGGTPEACGWLKDKYGLSWQIMPTRMIALLGDPDRARARRVGEAMLKMVKFDIAEIEQAAAGRGWQPVQRATRRQSGRITRCEN